MLVDAVIGAKRLGGFVGEAILEGHEALALGGYFAGGRHVVSFVLWDMRYGNLLESILHGLFGRIWALRITCLGVTTRIWAISSTPTPSVCSGRGASPATALMGLLTRRIGGCFAGEVCLLRRVVGEGSLCGRVVEGFLAPSCWGSLGGPSAALCGYASWLAWWWISGASMGIPSSLLSISSLEACVKRIALHLDTSLGSVVLRLRGL